MPYMHERPYLCLFFVCLLRMQSFTVTLLWPVFDLPFPCAAMFMFIICDARVLDAHEAAVTAEL